MGEMIQIISNNPYVFAFGNMLIAFIILTFGIREAYTVAKNNAFTVAPSSRRLHDGSIPFLGGISVYLSCLLTVAANVVFFKNMFNLSLIGPIFLGATIMVFVGVYDDLQDIAPRKKIFYQIFASIIIVILLQSFQINFFNLFGIDNLTQFSGLLFAIFMIVAIINAFNFIDGIDGLCSGLAIVTFLFFGGLGLIQNDFTLILLNFSIVGALIPAWYKNVYSKRKMFLGNSGSFLLSFIISAEVILLLSGYFNQIHFLKNSAPVILLSLLSFPLVDASRVIIIRLCKGTSPFSADRNHIHHHLIDLGLNHAQATLSILGYTVVITMISLMLRDLDINLSFAIMFCLAQVLLNIPTLMTSTIRRNKKLQESSTQETS